MDERVQRIERMLEGCALGRPLIILDEAGSTNDILKNRADGGAPEGCTVVADRQSRGRGRMGKTWFSPALKGLYMSVLLRPGWPASDATAIGILAALAVARALGRCGVAGIALKWPNDILAGKRKIGGILIEPGTQAGIMIYCVVGIGINVSHSAEDLLPVVDTHATSCRMEGSSVERDEVLAFSLDELDKLYRRASGGNREWITGEWANMQNPGQISRRQMP